MAKRFCLLALLPLLLAGCAAKFTNLTPQRLPRAADNLYPVEVAMNSRQRSMRWDTLRPVVVVGADHYPMQPTPLMTNRWETLVPVLPGENLIHYRFRFDYLYTTIPGRKPDSARSPTYQLFIVDK